MDTAPHDSLDAPSRKLKKAQMSLLSLKSGYDNACQQASQAASKVSSQSFASPHGAALILQAHKLMLWTPQSGQMVVHNML